ncbi:UPF0729 protein GD16342 [Drosophila ficusphila]|uniref:UPF0729 protein GD16342 n=1 Tax=Drosophila ficusphila TaxID=30025 RepID=UPI0007E5C119|nr:UPF0729 protein GD16342 [Drosophila ficusphila]
MVCVPCFIIPLLLYIWHKFVQPILLRYWNPWEKKDAEGNVIKKGPEFPFECKGGVCPFVPGAAKREGTAEGGPKDPDTPHLAPAAGSTAPVDEAQKAKKDI